MLDNTQVENDILQLIKQPLIELGYNIVRVKLLKDETLQIMIERLDAESINITDCTKVSKFIATFQEAQDLIEDNYNLEVSSPGVDRPLVYLSDFEKFIGKEIHISLHKTETTAKKFKAKLLGVEEVNIILLVNGTSEPATIAFENIASAKLAL